MKIKITILSIFLIAVSHVSAQVVVNTPLTGTQEFVYSTDICLDPGFSYTPSAGGYFLTRVEGDEAIPSANYVDPASIVDPDTRTIDTSLPVGAIPGTFDVSSTGAATYKIPIYTAPGTGGLVPSLSILYNSQAGNGLLGYGMELGGLSSITRVSKPYYNDHSLTGIHLDNNDGLALDGNLLILQVGNYGEDGSTYATETETFSTIKLHGNMNDAGSWFEVKLKNGNIIQYGNSEYSTITSQYSRAFCWNITKVTDPLTNYILFEYSNDSGTGQNILHCIKYTGNEYKNLKPYNTIYFKYQRREDENNFFLRYFADQKDVYHDVNIPKKLLLESIQCTSVGKVLRTYEFNYSFGTLYSHLYEVIESNESNQRLNSTLFKWGNMGVTYELSTGDELPHTLKYIYNGDFNGDGKLDYISTPLEDGYTSSNEWRLYMNSENGYVLTDEDDLFSGFQGFVISDINGDGVDDVIMKTRVESTAASSGYLFWLVPYKVANNKLIKLSGSELINCNMAKNYDTSAKLDVTTGDFDGNGKTDLLLLDSDKKIFDIVGITASSFPDLSTSDQVLAVDYNGDGKSEIISYKDGYISIYDYQISTSTFERIRYYEIGTNMTLYPGDFNGDGRTDFFVHEKGASAEGKILYSIGDGFTELEYDLGSNSTTYSNSFYVNDFNKDGLSDILFFEGEKWEMKQSYVRIESLELSTGTGFVSISLENISELRWGIGSENHYGIGVYQTDNNHDGIQDLYIARHGENSVYFNILPHYSENNLLSITNGLGLQTKISYSLTSEEDVYSHSNVNYEFPVSLDSKPMSVVSGYKIINLNYSTVLSDVTMSYSDSRKHNQGKGFLGFSKIITLNNISGLKTETQSSYDPTFFCVYPSVIKKSIYKELSGGGISETLISSTTNTLTPVTLDNGKRFFSYTSGSIESNVLSNTLVEAEINMDSNGNVLSNITKNKDAQGNIVSISTSVYSDYDTFGSPGSASETKEYGGRTKTTTTVRKYNTTGLLDKETKQSGSASVIKEYKYDDYSNMITESTSIGGETRITSYTYEDVKARYVKTKTDFQGNIKTYNCNPYTCNIVEEYDNTGENTKTQYAYDGFGNLIKTTYPDGQIKNETTVWSPGQENLMEAYYKLTTIAGKPTSITVYDILGRVLRTKTQSMSGDYLLSEIEYDTQGRIVRKTQPHFYGSAASQWVTFTYDNYGRVSTETVYPYNTITSYAYNGLTTTVTKSGRTYTTVSDAAGMKISSSDPGGTIHYVYNPDGKVISISSPSGTTTIKYDDFGNQEKLIDIDAGETNYKYDGFGQLLSQTDAKGNNVDYKYESGRLKTETWNSGLVKTYKYYSTSGLLQEISSSEGPVISYAYDEYKRTSLVTKKLDDNNSFTKSYNYDSYGRLLSTVTNSAFTETYIYNSYGYQTGQALNGALVWRAITQSKNGIISTYKCNGDKITTTLGFDPNGFLNSLTHTSTVAGVLEAWSYNNDYVTGNLTQRSLNTGGNTSLTELFTYDNQDRLTTDSIAGGSTRRIIYDVAGTGNITSKSDVGSYIYDDNIHAPSGITDPTDLMSSMPAQEITYTAFNKIETLKNTIDASNVRKLEWTYWPDFGRAKQVYRVNNQVNATRYYVFGNYEKEITPVATRELYYVNTPSGTVAVSVVQSGASSLYYISTDALGSFDVITSSAGTVVERNSFDPWGRRRNCSDWTYNNVSTSLFTGRGFTGHEHLLDFDHINMNGRIYDPVLALFISPDNFLQAPERCIGFDRYSYCFNNPLKFTDPSGNFALWSFVAGNALIYTMQWLNNVLNFGMSPGEAFKNTPITLSISGTFTYEERVKSDYSAYYQYSSSSMSYSDNSDQAQDYLNESLLYDLNGGDCCSLNDPLYLAQMQGRYLSLGENQPILCINEGPETTNLTWGEYHLQIQVYGEMYSDYNWVQTYSWNGAIAIAENGCLANNGFMYPKSESGKEAYGKASYQGLGKMFFYDCPNAENSFTAELSLFGKRGKEWQFIQNFTWGYSIKNGMIKGDPLIFKIEPSIIQSIFINNALFLNNPWF
jgi:RHS repeat-associated protein